MQSSSRGMGLKLTLVGWWFLFGVSFLLLSVCLVAGMPSERAKAAVEVSPPVNTPISTGDGSWRWQNPLPQGNSLRGISCPATNLCYAVGDSGTILKTTDGGASWLGQSSGVSTSLASIECPSPAICYALSSYGKLLRTSNGGASWSSQELSTKSSFYVAGLSCPSTQECYIVGNYGLIVATADGGETWQEQESGISESLVDVSCPNVATCYAVGVDGIILKRSGNSGWSKQTSNVSDLLLDISCPTVSACLITGYSVGPALRTTNGGQNWNGDGASLAFSPDDVTCPNAAVCFAVGGGRIARTTNFGTSWQEVFSDLSLTLSSIECLNADTCYSTGWYGLLLKTTSGGASWANLQTSLTNSDLHDVDCPGPALCYTVGKNNTILKTTNGGASWVVQNAGSPTGDLYGLTCLNVNTCYAVGSSGSIRKTINGSTWQSVPASGQATSEALRAISCLDATTCFVVGDRAKIVKITNGGANGTLQTSSASSAYNFSAIACPAGGRCYIAAVWPAYRGNYTLILANSPGNDSWTTQAQYDDNELLPGLSCPSANFCMAVGSYMPRGPAEGDTSRIAVMNGDGNWSRLTAAQPLGSLKDVACASPQTCFVLGIENVFKTSDGGSNWRVERVGTALTNSLGCFSNIRCYAVGNRGAILARASLVTSPADDGNGTSEGTLSFALTHAISALPVLLKPDDQLIRVTGALPPIPAGVKLLGNCNANGPGVTLDGTGVAASGLTLQGGNLLSGLKIRSFGGPQLKTTGRSNRLSCVAVHS